MKRSGRRLTDTPSTPPSAAARPRAWRASRSIRATPSDGAPGWLRVGNTGERNTRSAPARSARRSSAPSWADAVIQRPGGIGVCRRPPRRCGPQATCAARGVSPATVMARRRHRHIAATRAASAARPGMPSCRKTTPARPRGRRAIAGIGSGTRAASVNSHSGGGRPGRAARRAHRINSASMPRRSLRSPLDPVAPEAMVRA